MRYDHRVILTGASIVILWLFPEQILRLFNASDDMMSFGVPALKIMCVSYVFAAISTMLASYMQSTGRVKISIIINFLRQLVLLIPLMWLLSNLWNDRHMVVFHSSRADNCDR